MNNTNVLLTLFLLFINNYSSFTLYCDLLNRTFGAEGGVRTLAPLSRPNCLANNPLHHLGTSAF